MDSVTHVAFGAAIGEILMGHKLGKKAMLIGAIACTVPDLDVFLTMGNHDPLAYVQMHRSYSHAPFTHFFLALPLAYITYLLYKKKQDFLPLYGLWLVAMLLHSTVDLCTTFGTQFLLPFTNQLVAFNSINIIDPLYTLPMLVWFFTAWVRKRSNFNSRKFAIVAMVVSHLYMLSVLAAKGVAHRQFTNQLQQQHIPYTELSTTPAILNGMLWSGIAYNDSTISVGEYSIWDKDKNTRFVTFNRNRNLEQQYAGDKLNTVIWFSQGKYLIEPVTDTTARFYIIKWGRFDFSKNTAEQTFKFYYTLTKSQGKVTITVHDPGDDDFKFSEAFAQLWQRIFYY